jgi:cyclase
LKVLDLMPPDAKVIPGHGPLSTPADVREFLDMLKDTRALVAQAVKQGKTTAHMKKDRLLDR